MKKKNCVYSQLNLCFHSAKFLFTVQWAVKISKKLMRYQKTMSFWISHFTETHCTLLWIVTAEFGCDAMMRNEHAIVVYPLPSSPPRAFYYIFVYLPKSSVKHAQCVFITLEAITVHGKHIPCVSLILLLQQQNRKTIRFSPK